MDVLVGVLGLVEGSLLGQEGGEGGDPRDHYAGFVVQLVWLGNEALLFGQYPDVFGHRC